MQHFMKESWHYIKILCLVVRIGSNITRESRRGPDHKAISQSEGGPKAVLEQEQNYYFYSGLRQTPAGCGVLDNYA